MITNEKFIERLALIAKENNNIDPELYSKYDVKRGLRNDDSTGVVVGLTEIGEVHGYLMDEGEKVPDEGRLRYRGIDIKDIVKGFQSDKRFGFEETVYLLLFGELPTKECLKEFTKLIGQCRTLPGGFIEDMILKAPSSDIMNKLARSVLVCYSYDANPDEISPKNLVRQSLDLIAKFPVMAAYGYQAKSHYYDKKTLFIHLPKPELSTAENILHMIRQDNKYTKKEAEILDLILVLHAEHGGGNNSTFAARVVSSSQTDTYSAIAAAVGSLKGPKHGGANIKVIDMIEDIKNHINDWEDQEEIEKYLEKILKKEAFDKSGLIYGMGHAVYTLSDPRACILKKEAYKLSKEKNMEKEYNLYAMVEELSKKVYRKQRGEDKNFCANVDLYSGFVYSMLQIPRQMYTPLFSVSRVAGWCAHRIEELTGVTRIIRPAYRTVKTGISYTPIDKR